MARYRAELHLMGSVATEVEFEAETFAGAKRIAIERGKADPAVKEVRVSNVDGTEDEVVRIADE